MRWSESGRSCGKFHLCGFPVRIVPLRSPGSGNEAHWCHHFARPPWEIFSDPDWAEYACRMGIDLRSLPYSYLVLDRRDPVAVEEGMEPGPLGRCVHAKGYSRVFSCDACGVGIFGSPGVRFPSSWTPCRRRRVPVGRWRTEGYRCRGD